MTKCTNLIAVSNCVNSGDKRAFLKNASFLFITESVKNVRGIATGTSPFFPYLECLSPFTIQIIQFYNFNTYQGLKLKILFFFYKFKYFKILFHTYSLVRLG